LSNASLLLSFRDSKPPSMSVPLDSLHRVTLDWITPQAERVIARHARASTIDPDRSEYLGLLKYCISHGHYSVFEQACAAFEIITSRGISAQIIRHRSFCFQETSQRYCNPLDVLGHHVDDISEFELRSQDLKNRQNSEPYTDDVIESKYRNRIRDVFSDVTKLYDDMLADGVAKETARNILPMCSPTRLHAQGNMRSWLFYVGLRSVPGTQREHRYISNCVGRELRDLMPDLIGAVVRAAMDNPASGLEGWKFIDTLQAG